MKFYEQCGLPLDMWNLGVILYFMVSGRCPYPSNDIMSTCEDLPAWVPTGLRKLIEGFLNHGPLSRLTVKDADNRINEFQSGL